MSYELERSIILKEIEENGNDIHYFRNIIKEYKARLIDYESQFIEKKLKHDQLQDKLDELDRKNGKVL